MCVGVPIGFQHKCDVADGAVETLLLDEYAHVFIGRPSLNLRMGE